MAEIINEAPFAWPTPSGHSYPWDEWLNGNLWRLQQGVDFAEGVAVIRRKAYNAAKARGGVAHTKTRVEEVDGAQVVAFYIQFEAV